MDLSDKHERRLPATNQGCRRQLAEPQHVVAIPISTWASVHGIAALFNWHGRNKRSMTLDFRKDPEGDMFFRLVAVSDVLVENNSARTLDRLGVGDSWRKCNYIVALRMPPTGLTGPYQDYTRFGTSFEGLVGLRSIRGLPGTTPENAPSSLHMDVASGATGAFAVMAALRRARRTGVGV